MLLYALYARLLFSFEHKNSHINDSEIMCSMYYQYNISFIVGTLINQQFISCIIFHQVLSSIYQLLVNRICLYIYI